MSDELGHRPFNIFFSFCRSRSCRTGGRPCLWSCCLRTCAANYRERRERAGLAGGRPPKRPPGSRSCRTDGRPCLWSCCLRPAPPTIGRGVGSGFPHRPLAPSRAEGGGVGFGRGPAAPRRGVAPAGRTGEGGPWARSCVAEGLRRQRQGTASAAGRRAASPASSSPKPLPPPPVPKAGQALGGGPGCRGRRRGCLPWPPGPSGPCPRSCGLRARADNYRGDHLRQLRAGGELAVGAGRGPSAAVRGLLLPLPPAPVPESGAGFGEAWLPGPSEGLPSLAPGRTAPPAVVWAESARRQLQGGPPSFGCRRAAAAASRGRDIPAALARQRAALPLPSVLGWAGTRRGGRGSPSGPEPARAGRPRGRPASVAGGARGGAAGLAAGARCSPPSTHEKVRRLPGRGWWGVRRASSPWAWRRRGPCLRSCWLRDRADNPWPHLFPPSPLRRSPCCFPFCPLLLCSFLPVLTSGVVWCLLGFWAPSCALGKLGRRSLPRISLPPNLAQQRSRARATMPTGAAGVTSPRATPASVGCGPALHTGDRPLLTFGMVSECRPPFAAFPSRRLSPLRFFSPRPRFAGSAELDPGCAHPCGEKGKKPRQSHAPPPAEPTGEAG
ncbi:hypothetical protein C7M84_018127 [Penaeus vannamei]|uniref:Uncharacterized protein n=1 Tax=Penaeus vannamei TaxID=6689 RepID=A0A423SI50_PENVA|nr:hypothetical protein C7M84_018127 [Penaeus vannamei]